MHESDARHCANYRAVIGLLAAAPRSQLIDTPGLCASLVPVVPACTMANVAIVPEAAGLPTALPLLRAADGFRHSVWLPSAEATPAATMALRRAGFERVSTLPGMTLTLSEMTAGPVPDRLTAARSASALAKLARINADARTDADDLPSAWTLPDACLPPSLRVYLAWEGETAVSGLLTLRAGSDCVVGYVATVPAARRRGYAAGLLRAALADAATEGMVTSTLQADHEAIPLYERVGYRSETAFALYRLPASPERPA
ncbi:MAG: GNAT family N-acetyltransferase [Solirubrobacterales bacterium]|nr:GNAT family N-acetyltransferase [Solirubrobacterales bacterium]